MTVVSLTSAILLMLLQAPVTGTAVLQGRVVRADSGAAVAHAQIVAAKVGGALADYRTTETNAGGRFVIQGLTSGSYRIYAQRDGYLQTEYGRRPAGTTGIPVILAEGQTSASITIELVPPGVIAGQILDDGRPARNVWVRALKATYFDGRASFRIVEYARSDDRGEFRLFDLPPSVYVVSALPSEQPRIQGDAILFPVVPSNANQNMSVIGRKLTPESLDARALIPEVYTEVYHPGTTDVTQAAPVEVRAGSVTPGVALTLARTRPFRVRGTVSVTDAPAGLKIAIWVVPQQEATATAFVQVDVVNGAFEINGVPPGRYFLAAQAADGPKARLTAQPIEVVDRDLDGLVVTLDPGIPVKGRVSIDGTAPEPGPLVVQLQSMTRPLPGYSVLRLEPDGTFVLPNVAPGDYRLRVLDSQRGSWLKEARYGGLDALRSPIRIARGSADGELEIVLSTKTATIDALVLDRGQRPVTGAVVVAVPDTPRRDRSSNFRTATTDANGRVRIERIAPGEYTLFASSDIDAASWQDPNVLRMHQGRGETVRLLEGGAANVMLRITP